MARCLRRLAGTLASVPLLAMAVACSSTEPVDQAGAQKLQVVTTILTSTLFTKAVAGDCAQVISLLPAGADSHTYQARPQDVASLGLRYASSADEGLGALPLSARGPALLMLEEARGDALTLIGASAGPRTGVPREGWGRAGALRRAKALAKLAMPRYWPKNRPAHQRGLHAALRGLPGVSIYG